MSKELKRVNQLGATKMLFDAFKRETWDVGLDERVQEYEQFIEWLNSKPEYQHIYQQYLQQKYP